MDIDAMIAKYLSGESTPDETDMIEEWKIISDENDLIFRQSEDAWHLVNSHVKQVYFEKEKTWSGISKRINKRYTLPLLLRIAGIAASVAFIFGWSLQPIFTSNHQEIIAQQPQKITLFVPAGVCSKTVLPDGTVVLLNASSTISYPSYFEGDSRIVELIGEAFFDVSRDETKPFIINSGKLKVNVLGTSFNFKHYKEDTYAVLAVEKGKVALSTGASTTTTLEAGKYATVDTQTLQTAVFDTPPARPTKSNSSPAKPEMIDKDTYTDQFSSWRKHKMIFRDEPFNNVLNELSRRYNVEFEIRGNEIKNYIYTATFDDMSLEDVLNLLKISSPIDYSIKSLTSNTENAYEKRKITIFRK